MPSAAGIAWWRHAFARCERLRFHQHRIRVRQIALEHGQAARGFRHADDVLLVVAAARYALRLQNFFVSAAKWPCIQCT